jgi:hypothetical protein
MRRSLPRNRWLLRAGGRRPWNGGIRCCGWRRRYQANSCPSPKLQSSEITPFFFSTTEVIRGNWAATVILRVSRSEKSHPCYMVLLVVGRSAALVTLLLSSRDSSSEIVAMVQAAQPWHRHYRTFPAADRTFSLTWSFFLQSEMSAVCVVIVHVLCKKAF